MKRTQLTPIKKTLRALIKTRGLDCKLITIGTGVNVELGLEGGHAAAVARFLETKLGFVATPMSGAGGVITLDCENWINE